MPAHQMSLQHDDLQCASPCVRHRLDRCSLRMARLHMHLAEHNIYKWLADIFTTLEHIQGASDSAALGRCGGF